MCTVVEYSCTFWLDWKSPDVYCGWVVMHFLIGLKIPRCVLWLSTHALSDWTENPQMCTVVEHSCTLWLDWKSTDVYCGWVLVYFAIGQKLPTCVLWLSTHVLCDWTENPRMCTVVEYSRTLWLDRGSPAVYRSWVLVPFCAAGPSRRIPWRCGSVPASSMSGSDQRTTPTQWRTTPALSTTQAGHKGSLSNMAGHNGLPSNRLKTI